ncbi:myosin light chain 2, putative [Eimeria tenella]|uniref:Myosin light chain 2, putative n=1 Tax=Eimeria tenella TaxID=5802 RepID=U6L2D4_EIMTE|nr:myosin light chain 2, putative [Eimeria tenella]CDJ42774.1 myosin light chain 2, putative [Eimeria tenella]|eukprot:XP_013233524.1 myosin light chain 2, putative [Eimeria tenella]
MSAKDAPPTRQPLTSRASMVGTGGDFSTVVLVDVAGKPLMNLHRVPQHVTVSDVKRKISERLKEVGRNLPADLMILKYGENAETEMEEERPLTFYNTMGLSKVQVQISKRHKFDINVVVVKPEAKCLCIKKTAREELPFMVRVPSTCYVKQLRMEIARRMNCNVDRHELELFFDPELQEHIVIEGTCRARGINHLGTVYTKFPPNFDIDHLAPLEVPRETVADEAAKKEEQATSAAVEQKPAEDILTDTTEAEEDKGAPKSAIQLDFEKAAGKNLTMSSAQAADFARKLGYSPSSKDAASLPTQVDYKAFQTFLTGALHAEDLAEAFQQFFALFDTQGSGDLSAKQLCNIVQMYGNEPLSKDEAKKFTEIVMGSEGVLPIKVIVDRIMEGQI